MKIVAYGVRQDERPYFDAWQAANPQIELQLEPGLLDETSAALANGADGVVVFQQKSYSGAILQRLSDLGIKNVSLRNVGVDNVDAAMVKKLGMKITNVPVYSPPAIAEFTVTQLMQLLRRTKEYERKFAQQDFRWAPQMSQELNQQVVGVVGTGNIGRAAIKIYQGFGAKVIAYDKFHNEAIEKQELYVDSLEELYRQATVITLHIPLFTETTHMLNEQAFAQMNDGVFIINAARGPLIDEQALIDALDSKKVAGAALDVLEDETKVFNRDLKGKTIDYPVFSNLFARDNVLISPHTAFYTDISVKNMVNISLDSNKELIETGKAKNLVSFR